MPKPYFPNSKIQSPREIISRLDEATKTMHLEITKPHSNMQDDPAAFEAWTLLLLATGACEKVSLSFQEINLDKSRYFENLCPHQQHYFRFLYRLEKFLNQFSKVFSLAEHNQKEYEFFRDNFTRIKKKNNYPKGPSKYNPDKGLEHVLEKGFSTSLELRQKIGIAFPLNDQLPNGLFLNSVKESNRIFCTGNFDLWGVFPQDTLHLFELKEPKNKKAGIISELYFYANFAYDLLNEKGNFVLNNKETQFRGYNHFASGSVKMVKAYFLVDSYHAAIEGSLGKILSLLNENSNIEYSSKKYSLSVEQISNLKDVLKSTFSASKEKLKDA